MNFILFNHKIGGAYITGPVDRPNSHMPRYLLYLNNSRVTVIYRTLARHLDWSTGPASCDAFVCRSAGTACRGSCASKETKLPIYPSSPNNTPHLGRINRGPLPVVKPKRACNFNAQNALYGFNPSKLSEFVRVNAEIGRSRFDRTPVPLYIRRARTEIHDFLPDSIATRNSAPLS